MRYSTSRSDLIQCLASGSDATLGVGGAAAMPNVGGVGGAAAMPNVGGVRGAAVMPNVRGVRGAAVTLNNGGIRDSESGSCRDALD
eukprot:61247-Rhodomonas_salina.1